MPRQAPQQHASQTKVGTILEGQDGEKWVVKKLSDGTQRWVPYLGVVFVFYTIHPQAPKKTWTYTRRFPAGWDWTGAGSTAAVGDPPKAYQREEQFNGPRERRQAMKEYLKEFFQGLKDKGVVTKFKIRYKYDP
jgi:hypothetical protein